MCSQFPRLYKVISVKNPTVSVVLGNSYPLSWNFNFRRNLTDIEKLNSFRDSCPPLVQCMFLLLWQIQELGFCPHQTCLLLNLFFIVLSNFSNLVLFLPTKFLWRSKAPSKVKALAWLLVHRKVNINNKLQLQIPLSLVVHSTQRK